MRKFPKLLILLSLGWVSSSAQAYYIQVLQGSSVLGTVLPYTGTLTAANNYNYYANSGHPVNGPTPMAQQGRIWFYEGSDGLAWNVIFNAVGSVSVNGSARWNINITGSTSNPGVVVSDDAGQLKEPTNNQFTGTWGWASSLTDGGVIAPLGTGWTINVTPTAAYTGVANLAVCSSGDSTTCAINSSSGGLNLNQAFQFRYTDNNNIPEPGAGLLLFTGLIAALGWRQRKTGRQLAARLC